MADQDTNVTNEKYEYYITSKDNPYDPKTQYNEWYVYDLMLGYNTLQRLDKMEEYLATTLQSDDEDAIHEAAISELIRLDPLNVYIAKRYTKEPDQYIHLTDEQQAEIYLAKEL